MPRNHFSVVTLAVLVCAGLTITASAQGPAPAQVSLEKFPLTVPAGDYELVQQIIDLPAGSSVPKHSHGGSVLVTVITGQLTLMDARGDRVVKAGQSWTEKAGDVHSVANKGKARVRVAASYLVPKGAELMTPAK